MSCAPRPWWSSTFATATAPIPWPSRPSCRPSRPQALAGYPPRPTKRPSSAFPSADPASEPPPPPPPRCEPRSSRRSKCSPQTCALAGYGIHLPFDLLPMSCAPRPWWSSTFATATAPIPWPSRPSCRPSRPQALAGPPLTSEGRAKPTPGGATCESRSARSARSQRCSLKGHHGVPCATRACCTRGCPLRDPSPGSTASRAALAPLPRVPPLALAWRPRSTKAGSPHREIWSRGDAGCGPTEAVPHEGRSTRSFACAPGHCRRRR